MYYLYFRVDEMEGMVIIGYFSLHKDLLLNGFGDKGYSF